MAAAGFIVTLAICLALSSSFSHAFDANPLQDFCVAVSDTSAAGKFDSKLQILNIYVWNLNVAYLASLYQIMVHSRSHQFWPIHFLKLIVFYTDSIYIC